MPTQQNFFFGNGTVTSVATAVSVRSLIVAGGYIPTGGCVSLNVTFDADTYWGNSSTVTDSAGALLASGTALADSGTGLTGNVIPINEMYVYKAAAGDANGVIYARFIP